MKRRSHAWRGDPQPVSVGIAEVALPSCQPLFVNPDAELVGDGVDVSDVQVDDRSKRLVLTEWFRWAS